MLALGSRTAVNLPAIVAVTVTVQATAVRARTTTEWRSEWQSPRPTVDVSGHPRTVYRRPRVLRRW